VKQHSVCTFVLVRALCLLFLAHSAFPEHAAGGISMPDGRLISPCIVYVPQILLCSFVNNIN